MQFTKPNISFTQLFCAISMKTSVDSDKVQATNLTGQEVKGLPHREGLGQIKITHLAMVCFTQNFSLHFQIFDQFSHVKGSLVF